MPAYLTLPAHVLGTLQRRHLALHLYRELRRENWRRFDRHGEPIIEALAESDPQLDAPAYAVQLTRSLYFRALEAATAEEWHAWHAMRASGVVTPYFRDQDRRGHVRLRRNLMTKGASPEALAVLDRLLDAATILRLDGDAFETARAAPPGHRLMAVLERGVNPG